MGSVVPSLAGPKRPQDKVILTAVDDEFNADLKKIYDKDAAQRVAVAGKDHDIGDGDVVIAAITSCTNRSEEHTSELQSLMRISYAVFCLKNKHQIQQ